MAQKKWWRRYAESAVFTIAGAEASRRQAVAMGLAQGVGQQQASGAGAPAAAGAEGESFWEWIKMMFPSLTREDNIGFSSMIETYFQSQDRKKINTLLKAMLEGIELDGKKRKFDQEQFIMDLFKAYQAWEAANPAKDRQKPEQKPMDRGYQRNLASLMLKLFNEPEMMRIRAFIDELKQNKYDQDQFVVDLMKMYDAEKKKNPDLDDRENPAVKVLTKAADSADSFGDKRTFVYHLGLLTEIKEIPAIATGENPVVKLLREVVQYDTIPEQIDHLQDSQRVIEMTTGRLMFRYLVKNPFEFALATFFTVAVPVLLIVIIIHLASR